MAQWSRWWWCLMVITADAGLASGVEECFLYPVKKGEESPRVPVNATTDTIITINNIYDNNTVTTITTDDGACVAQVLHNSTDQLTELGCPVLNTSAVNINTGTWQEVMTVVVRRGGGRTTVYLRDTGDEEQLVKVHLGDASTLHVVSNEYVNVAYGCYHGCFQFQKATIHKSFRDGRLGSLLFYGQVMGSGPPNGTIFALRGGTTWHQRRGFYPQDSIMNHTHWFAFRALLEYGRDNKGKDTLTLTLRYETAASNCSPENPACNTGHNESYLGAVPSKDLYLTFDATEKVRWAVFCRPRATSKQPGEEDPPALTTTTSTTTINSSFLLNNSYQTDDYQDAWKWLSNKNVKNWVVVVLGGCSVLLLVVTLGLAAALHRRRPRPPPEPSTSPSLNDADDPSGHIYEYVDLDSLKKQLAQDQSASQMDLSNQNNTRKRHSSVNSLYGCISHHTTETTTQ